MFRLSRITAAAVGALGIAAFATAGTAAANTVDDTFIEVINQQGIQPPSSAEAISVAHDACAVIDGGGDIAAAVNAVSDATKLDFEDSAFFVGGAIASYCPEHENLIG
ncbi:DUF732 domain-containing protein [Mycolicibacterium celeriflavum]|uniref:DUF732 domain-containing protein n=1 Tax=Mycolicibacterium celeriflavum TaxID=1249101 RepID=UPI003CF631DA